MVPIVFPFIKNPVKYRNYFRKSEMVTATFETWFSFTLIKVNTRMMLD